jgi:C_GCAxxG_C_C family probable redox protein
MNQSIAKKNDAKKVFWKMGSCSRTFFYLLDREFDNLQEEEEKASDTFAGGIVQKGHQCGMLWGASLAVGLEAYRRSGTADEAVGLAIIATQDLVRSFTDRTGTVNCREITKTDFSKKWQFFKYMLFKAKDCFNMAEIWAPEAIETAKESLSQEQVNLPERPRSCATEVLEKMGASKEEAVTVAGFAGGIGLSGNACGALGAAIWYRTLAYNHTHKKPLSYKNHPVAKKIIEKFYKETNNKIKCSEICGRAFNGLEEHTQFIKNGCCKNLILALAGS